MKAEGQDGEDFGSAFGTKHIVKNYQSSRVPSPISPSIRLGRRFPHTEDHDSEFLESDEGQIPHASQTNSKKENLSFLWMEKICHMKQKTSAFLLLFPTRVS